MSENCPICQTACGRMSAGEYSFAYECPRCGNFILSYHNKSDLERTFINAKAHGEEDEKRAIISHSIRNMQKENAWPKLKGDSLKAMLKRSLPTPTEQKDIFIRWVGDNIKAGGDYVKVNSLSILAIIGARTLKEFYFILEHSKKKGLIESKTVVGGGDIDIVEVTLSFDGLEYYKELKKGNNNKKKEQDTMPPTAETQKMIKLFISHSSKDKEIAEKLTELVKNALRLSSEEIRCTTIDGYRLPGGAKTNEQIKREVRDSTAFIGLISTAAAESMYVLFELGARWGSDKHLLPLLAPDVSPDILKGPLSDYNAISCESSAQLQQLIQDLSKVLKIKPESPAAYQQYIDGIQNFIVAYEEKKTDEEVKIDQETKEADFIDWFNKLEKPLDRIKFKNVINRFNSCKLSKNKKFTIKLSIKKNDGKTINGFYAGAIGQSAAKGYRYFLESETGISQGAILLTDIESILDFALIKNF